jgi:hypothetical protein
MSFLAIMISTIGLIQTLRIRKYFFGDWERWTLSYSIGVYACRRRL